MSLVVSNSGGGESNFKPVPPGMHLARCYRVIDMGTQRSEWQGDVKLLHKIMIQFEVHGEDEEGNPMVTNKGEPMSISKNYTASLGEKSNLRKDLVTWRGREFTADELKGFQMENLLGVWAMLSVAKSTGNNGKEYTNIMSINPVPKTIKANLPEGHNETKMFSLQNPDMELFESFSKSLKEKISSSPEFQSFQPKQGATASSFEDMSDDIPF